MSPWLLTGTTAPGSLRIHLEEQSKGASFNGASRVTNLLWGAVKCSSWLCSGCASGTSADEDSVSCRAASEDLPFSFSMPPKARRAGSMRAKLWGIKKDSRKNNLRVYSQVHQSSCQLSHETAFILVLEEMFSVPGRAKAALQEGNSKTWRTKLNFYYYKAWKRIPALIPYHAMHRKAKYLEIFNNSFQSSLKENDRFGNFLNQSF